MITQTVSVPLQENLTDSIDLSVACRMCGIYLLAYAEVESEFKLKAYSVMMLALAHIVQNNAQELTEIAVANQLGRIGGKYPFSWDDIVSFQPQILAHKICNHTVTTDAGMEDAWFEEKGTVRLSKGVLSIASISKDELLRGTLVPSLEVMEGTIHILSGKGDKVKKSDLDNLEKMSDFTRDFLRYKLRALGLNIGDGDARVLLDEGFDCSGYGLTKAGTRKLSLLDHIIISDSRWYSFADESVTDFGK